MKFPRYRDIRSRLMVDLPRLTGDRRPLTFLLQREDLPVDKTEIPLLSSARISKAVNFFCIPSTLRRMRDSLSCSMPTFPFEWC